jgi:hypothetical protein
MSVWSFQSLRNALVPPNDELPEDKRWMADIPFNTRQLSIKSTGSSDVLFKLRQVNQEPRCQGSRAKGAAQTFGVDSIRCRTGTVS